MDILEIMVRKTQFEKDVPTMDIGSSERTITTIFNFYLTRDKIRREVILYHGNNYTYLEWYVLKVAEEFQNSETGAFR